MRKIDKPWGHELVWTETENYVGKVLHIKKGHRLSLQYHEKKDETIFLRKGTAKVEFGENRESIILSQYHKLTADGRLAGPDVVLHIPPGTIHRIEALTDVEIVEVSTPELEDVIRLEDDFNRV